MPHDDTARILEAARQRGESGQMPYAGALMPEQALALLRTCPEARLVDVRTNAERDWVGRVQIPESQHQAIQWMLYPGGTPNPDFLTQLKQVAGKEDVLLFLCRSGVRSRNAAQKANEAGYGNCFDILEGFEGEKDENGHRKTRNGWCFAGLPWVGA